LTWATGAGLPYRDVSAKLRDQDGHARIQRATVGRRDDESAEPAIFKGVSRAAQRRRACSTDLDAVGVVTRLLQLEPRGINDHSPRQD
jgi:hypothetical protein